MTENYFHTYDGWCFRRTAGGFVDLFMRFDDGKEEFLASFNPSTWASVVAFVSAQGLPSNVTHDDEPYRRALWFHSGKDEAYADTNRRQALSGASAREVEVLARLRAMEARIRAALEYSDPIDRTEIDAAIAADLRSGLSLRKTATKHGTSVGIVRGIARTALTPEGEGS
jgi:hypothetical protein